MLEGQPMFHMHTIGLCPRVDWTTVFYTNSLTFFCPISIFPQSGQLVKGRTCLSQLSGQLWLHGQRWWTDATKILKTPQSPPFPFSSKWQRAPCYVRLPQRHNNMLNELPYGSPHCKGAVIGAQSRHAAPDFIDTQFLAMQASLVGMASNLYRSNV